MKLRDAIASVRLPGASGVVGVALLAAACGGGSSPPPEPGTARGGVPDLAGTSVMVFPVQDVRGLPPGGDAELAFALESRGPGVGWVGPDELRSVVARTPGMDVRVDGLPVAAFLQAEVNRIGDPLFGYLIRLGAVTDGEVALLPVQARYAPAAPGGEDEAGEPPGPGRAEVRAALVHVRSGRVLWYGVAAGAPGSPDDPAVLASAMDALARMMLPAARGGMSGPAPSPATGTRAGRHR